MEKQTEEQGQEKTFTQEEVNRIIQERLSREKGRADHENLEEREKNILQREQKLACREYVLEKGYDADLVDILDTSNVDEFKGRADKLARKMCGDSVRMAEGTGSTGNFQRRHYATAKTEDEKIKEAMGLK